MDLMDARAAFLSPRPLPHASTPIHSSSAPRFPVCARAAGPPRQVAGATKQLREAIQAALRNQCSRMDLELPYGADFALEKRTDSTKRSPDVSDRELARMIVEMFAGNDLRVAVAFEREDAARAARAVWGPAVGDCAVVSLEQGGKAKGFGARGKKRARAAADNLPGELDVLVLAGVRSADALRKVAEGYGQGTVVLLVNARLEEVDPTGDLADVYERVYHFKPDPHPSWKGGILFRKYPDAWLLCRKAPVGPPTRLLEREGGRPTMDEIADAFRNEAEKPQAGLMDKIASFWEG